MPTSSDLTINPFDVYTIPTTSTTTYYASAPMTVSFSDGVSEKFERQMEKVDQHVDELEEDMECFNKSRLEMEEKMSAMIARMDALEKNNEALKSMVDYLMKSLNI